MPDEKKTAVVKGFCCNYTARLSEAALIEAGIVPDSFQIERLPCTGRLEVTAVLDAFSAGVEAVFVAGCKQGTCHNMNGSKRASKRLIEIKKTLQELGIEPERVEMFFVPRAETEPVVEAYREMVGRVERLGLLHKAT